MSLIYISDTNIWIDFRNAGLLEQMFKLPFTLCCTDFVLYELEDILHDELLAQGLLVESFDESGVQKLVNLKIEHGNSSMADVSCYLLAHTTGRPLLTGDGETASPGAERGHPSAWRPLATGPHDRAPHNHLISRRASPGKYALARREIARSGMRKQALTLARA